MDKLTTGWRGLAAKSDPYIGKVQVKDMGPGYIFVFFRGIIYAWRLFPQQMLFYKKKTETYNIKEISSLLQIHQNTKVISCGIHPT